MWVLWCIGLWSLVISVGYFRIRILMLIVLTCDNYKKAKSTRGQTCVQSIKLMCILWLWKFWNGWINYRHFPRFYTLQLFRCTRAYLFSPDEGSCCAVFMLNNSCCFFLFMVFICNVVIYSETCPKHHFPLDILMLQHPMATVLPMPPTLTHPEIS